MSVWKKVSKISQKRHRERHQPHKRSRLGLLEKHKDYVKRANDYHKKEKVIKKLREKALNRNPNEYYHHMVNAEIQNDRHIDKRKPLTEHTIEQKLVLEHKNISYVDLKLNIETKKLEKLQSRLHFIDCSRRRPKVSSANNEESISKLSTIDEKTLIKSHTAKEKQYKELLKRIERKQQLTIIKQKMEVQLNLKKTKRISHPKMISKGSKTKPAVYEWKYERKK